MGPRSTIRRGIRPPRPALTPRRVALLYVVALFGLMGLFLLLPEWRAIESLLLAWCCLFLVFAIGVLVCLMTACLYQLGGRAAGRIRVVLGRAKGRPRRLPAAMLRLDPLWDRWTDG